MTRFTASTIAAACALAALAACGEDQAVIAAKRAAAEAKKSEEDAAKRATADTLKDEEVAKALVRKSLKDPDSAKFGKFTIAISSTPKQEKDQGKPMRFICLTVNARNAFGGYTGDQQAYVVRLDEHWKVLKIENESHEECILVMQSSFGGRPVK